ncbi:MAG TPA: hypothetical protein VFL95_01160 [Gemmatimonadales bacterium]|nr:hypothetical protein [Gemmatimonadales bacterium]
MVRFSAVVIGLCFWAAAGAAAQVAPTLPGDTLGGKPLPPGSAVPRTPVAPTLPGDTLTGSAPAPTPILQPGDSTPQLFSVPRTPRGLGRPIAGAIADSLKADSARADSARADSARADSAAKKP